MEPKRLSHDAARRIAVASAGLARPRPTGKVTRQHLRRVFDDIGQIQIDSVNVLVRSQEMPLFSRLGPHPRTLIPDAAADGELFEYWGHALCLMPTKHHHLHRWRMELNADPENWKGFAKKKQDLIDNLLEQIRQRGPLAIGDFEGRVRNKAGSWWNWDDTKTGVEWLFVTGRVTARRRPSDFARLYDLPERSFPGHVLATPATPEAEARKQLLLQAARSLGVATANELAFYHFQKLPTVRGLLAELVDAGELIPAEVEGWDKPAFLHPAAAAPRKLNGRALISPFDPLMWSRERVSRIFGFDYQIEIYVPAPKRVYGYYVLPFLLDGHLAARVDLKADRAAGVLRVQAAWIEPDLDNPVDRPHVAEQLAAELADVARWLDLAAIGVTDRGNLAVELLRSGLQPLEP